MKQKGICMKRIIYITIACAFLSVSFAKAQVLTLKECLEEGLRKTITLYVSSITKSRSAKTTQH